MHKSGQTFQMINLSGMPAHRIGRGMLAVAGAEIRVRPARRVAVASMA